MSHETGCGGKAVGLSPYYGDRYSPGNAVDGDYSTYWSTDSTVLPYRKFWWYFSFSEVKAVKMVNIVLRLPYCMSIKTVSIVARDRCSHSLRTLYDAVTLKSREISHDPPKLPCSGKRHFNIDFNKIGLYRCYGIQLMLHGWNYGAISEVEFFEGIEIIFYLLKHFFFLSPCLYM